MASPRYRVYLRDVDYQIVDELTDWLSLSLVLRFNGVGTWTLECSTSSPSRDMIHRTAGIVVRRDGVTIFSGSVATEHVLTYRTISVGGVDDNVLLEEPARPDPSITDPPFVSAYDVRTGVPSTVMSEYVYFNIGPGSPVLDDEGNPVRIDALVTAADPLLGTSITGRANFQSLLALLSELAVTPQAGGLGFRIIQSDSDPTKLEFRIWQPVDRSAEARFGVQLGTAQDYEDTWNFAGANYWVVMGGDGFGANRTIVAGGDTPSITEIGRRITGVHDARGITDPGELNQKLAELLAGAVASRKTTIAPFEVPSLEFGTDWDFGDIVAVVINNETTPEVVRDVEIEVLKDGGARITPMIGHAGSGNDERIAAHLKTVQDRLSNIERNWGVPDNSITRAMLTAANRPPIGQVAWLAHTTVPAGWLAASGQVVQRALYADLFALLGTTWNTGGEAGTDFRLPDLRNRSPIGSGSTYSIGQLVGAATAAIADHQHTGAPHTHPGSHSHGMSNHTHPGATHTHPGSHSHGLVAHRHQMGHDHTVNINHNHGGITGGPSSNTLRSTTAPTLNVATDFHWHDIATHTGSPTSSNSNNTVTGDGETTSGGFAFTSTAADTNAPAASAGSTGVPAPNSSDGDSTVFAASYSGSSGLAGAATTSIVHPSAGLMPVIYAGV